MALSSQALARLLGKDNAPTTITKETIMLKSDTLLSPTDVAKIVGIKNAQTIRRWYYEKKMPQPDFQSHKFVRWHASTLEEFLKNPFKWRQNNVSNES